ncbi:hypothetical protein M569_00070 [Genlisea aurea]|uniref:Uncharacterized protein n=1 Tax=Genlisea aurea TaxID=192259 RepID=S8D5J3_9LAMI|nr:hypothetical protein M569_00070 [Genlisea aurea]
MALRRIAEKFAARDAENTATADKQISRGFVFYGTNTLKTLLFLIAQHPGFVYPPRSQVCKGVLFAEDYIRAAVPILGSDSFDRSRLVSVILSLVVDICERDPSKGRYLSFKGGYKKRKSGYTNLLALKPSSSATCLTLIQSPTMLMLSPSMSMPLWMEGFYGIVDTYVTMPSDEVLKELD